MGQVVLLAYLDESYDRNRYWIAALVCPETDVASLTNLLDAAVAKAAAAHPALGPRAELHGYEMFQAKRDWADVPLRLRIAAYSDAMAAICESGVAVIIRGVASRGLIRRYTNPYHPHTVVLGHLLERIDEHAEDCGERVLVIADEVDDPTQHRDDLWRYQRYATDGYRSRQLTRIVDTIQFLPSKASRLLQGADLLAFLCRRVMSRADHDPRSCAVNRQLWEAVTPKLVRFGCWHP